MADLSYLQDRPIAVLGGGAVAKAVSADSARNHGLKNQDINFHF